MFKLHSEYKPTGDQPRAIEYLSKGIEEGKKNEKIKNIKSFLLLGIDVETIAKGTGISVEEVKRIKEETKNY